MTLDHCTLWLEGVWAHCCQIHDASALDIAAAVALGHCVAATGNVAMGLVMATVVIVLGPVYLWIQRRRRR